MGHPDRKGYYRVLGVAPKASAEAIKKAFRKRSKDLHPDHNQRVGAEMQFAALTEAYAVLSDPEARARYDTQGLEFEAPGGEAKGRGIGSPVPCGRCGKVSAQPRYLIFHQIIGEFTRVVCDRVQGIYCPRCARDVAVGASLLTWGVGWWGLPDGPVKTVQAIWRNVRGGDMPAVANHRLLAYQARAFAKAGKHQLSLALAREALARQPDGEEAALMREMLGEGEAPVLKDLWRPSRAVAFTQLAPALMIVLGMLYVAWSVAARPAPPGLTLTLPPVAEQREGPRAAHVAVDGSILRAAPSVASSAVAHLNRFEPLTLSKDPALTGTDGVSWFQVRAGDLDGYLPMEQVGGGTGQAALLAWCGEGAEVVPGNGEEMLRRDRGPHTLVAANQTGADALLKLRNTEGRAVLAVYLRAGAVAQVKDVPEGELRPVYATGSRYSRTCGTFLLGMTAHAVIEPLSFASVIDGSRIYAQTTHLTLDDTGVQAVAVDASVFSGE